jgi:hypothetical protein
MTGIPRRRPRELSGVGRQVPKESEGIGMGSIGNGVRVSAAGAIIKREVRTELKEMDRAQRMDRHFYSQNVTATQPPHFFISPSPSSPPPQVHALWSSSTNDHRRVDRFSGEKELAPPLSLSPTNTLLLAGVSPEVLPAVRVSSLEVRSSVPPLRHASSKAASQSEGGRWWSLAMAKATVASS